MLYIVPEHFVQFPCDFLVKDESIRFVVVPEAAAVQVGGAYCAKNVIDHHYFRMMEAAIIHIYSGSSLHQFMEFVEGGIRCKRDVRWSALLMEEVGTKYGLTMCTFFCAE